MRVGLVGCGLIGRRRAEVLRRFPDDSLVVAADVDAQRAATVANAMDCQAVTAWQDVVGRDDVEIVIAATTNDWLAPVATAALERGKHVLVEKPMGHTPADGERVLQAAAAHPGTVLKVGFNHRHHAAVQRAHELLVDGAIGTPLFARCRYGHGGRPAYDQEWRTDRQVSGGGELLDQGMHIVDLFRWFLGEFAMVCGWTATWVWAGGRPVEDNAFALLRTPGGQIASLHASWTQWKNLFSFEVFGDRGYLLAEGLGGSYGPEVLTIGRRRMDGGAPEETRQEFPGPDQSWSAEWQEFSGAIRAGRQPLGNGEDGLRALRLVHAIYESGRRGGTVAVHGG